MPLATGGPSFIRYHTCSRKFSASDRSSRKTRRTALSGSPSIVEPRTITTGCSFTRRGPPPKGKSSSRTPPTAAKDNETLDHLLSVVNDKRNVSDLHRIAKPQDGHSRGRQLPTGKHLIQAKPPAPHACATASRPRPNGAGSTSSHRRANLPRYEFGITIAKHF